MKKLFTAVLIFISTITFAQNVILSQEDLNKLTPEQRQVILNINKTNQVKENIETIGKYAGIGKEVGIAVNDGLKAISATAVDLSEKKLGKWIMIIITWKVIGTDLLQIVAGTIWYLAVSILFIILYYNNCERRHLISKTFNTDGKGWEVKYETIQADDSYKTGSIFMLIIGYLIGILILFL